MAVERDRPYAQFNFLVDLGDGVTDDPVPASRKSADSARRSTSSSIATAMPARTPVMKITGLNKVSDVVLRRGIVGASHLYQWLDQVRNGDQGALRTVTISLQSEDHTSTVMTWKLLRARIIKHTSGPLNARGNDVAVEEIVLAYERLEIE